MYLNSMYSVFTGILEMSIIASVSIIVLLLFRPVLKKFPRIISYFLWGIVLFRLVCPVSFQSPISILKLSNAPFMSVLFPGQEADEKRLQQEDEFEYVISDEVVILEDEAVTWNVVDEGNVEETHNALPVNHAKVPVWKWLLPVIWIIGMGGMLGYGVGSYISLKRELIGTIKEKDRIYSCDYVKTAFVMGFLFPRIYLPSDLEEAKKEFVILHEQVHMRRKDYLFRLSAYIVLSVHWFNPLVWMAFYLSGVDMEISCDEAVMRKAKKDIRKEYAEALLEMASGNHIFFAGYPAFGENQTKARIKSVVNYKKKSRILFFLGAIIVVFFVLVLASDPKWSGGQSAVTTVDTNENIEKGKREAFAESKIREWAVAFCNRDGNTIVNMSTPEARKVYEKDMLLEEGVEGVSFGWSSPWPVMETDYSIKLMEETRAIVLYYARTSDPHVIVWAENLEFELGENFEEEDDFKVTNSELLYLDSIDNVAEFVLAYEEGINNTPMDYLTNESGEALNKNAIENRDSVWYENLFSPETAVISLLNIDSEKVSIDVSEGETEEEVILTLIFQTGEAENNSVLQGIKMIRPFGEDGIWIPQNYTDSVLMENGSNYFNHLEFYKEKLGENFLEEHYEKVYTVESDISRDGMDEIIEVYTGNGGDGESGYVFVKDDHGNLLFHEYAHVARVAWNMVFLSEDNFLMNVFMEDRDTRGEYRYEVYRVVGKDEIQILAKDSFSFVIEGKTLDEDKKQELQEFMENLQMYLEQSELLLSTQENELKAKGLSEEGLTLEEITAYHYLWKKLAQGMDLEPIG